MFHNREDAALQLADKLRGRPMRDPLVLAIPRGGVVIGAILARELRAELDVVLSRKLRAPGQPELAIGAVSEAGQVYLQPLDEGMTADMNQYLKEEIQLQLDVIDHRKQRFRRLRPQAPVSGRSVIVTDDGIATGATMIAGLRVARALSPSELIVAVPVASLDRLEEVARWCDSVVCLHSPREFWAIGPFYEDFTQVSDEEVVELLRQHAPGPDLPLAANSGAPHATHASSQERDL
jgi:predicted phosphoribosyltransferase